MPSVVPILNLSNEETSWAACRKKVILCPSTASPSLTFSFITLAPAVAFSGTSAWKVAAAKCGLRSFTSITATGTEALTVCLPSVTDTVRLNVRRRSLSSRRASSTLPRSGLTWKRPSSSPDSIEYHSRSPSGSSAVTRVTRCPTSSDSKTCAGRGDSTSRGGRRLEAGSVGGASTSRRIRASAQRFPPSVALTRASCLCPPIRLRTA